jgi:hypothetical protein
VAFSQSGQSESRKFDHSWSIQSLLAGPDGQSKSRVDEGQLTKTWAQLALKAAISPRHAGRLLKRGGH